MDRLDLDVLRAMSRDKVCWWGGFHPRVSSDELARALGIAGSTVRARLNAWQRDGFLRGFSVIPHPSIFGATLAHGMVRVDDVRAKPRVLEDLALVEGVAGALDQVGPWIDLSYVYEHPAELERRRRLVARIAGVVEAHASVAFGQPGCGLTPTEADWRLIAALREDPRGSVASIAERAGMSVRTFTRRYHALVEARAIFFMPLLDFSRFSGGVVARLMVHRAPDADAAALAAALREAFPDLLELWNPWTPLARRDVLNALVLLPTAGAVEDALRRVHEIEGVAAAEHSFPRRWYAYPQWFDDRIARLVAPRSPVTLSPSIATLPELEAPPVAPRM